MPLQTHIHLSNTLSGSPEYSPTYTWRIRDRQIAIRFSVSVDESLNLTRYDHAIEDKVYKDFFYDIRVEGDQTYSTEEYLDILLSLAGKRVYIVDSNHPDDGEDHTDSVRLVRIVKVGDVSVDHTALERYYIPIFTMSLSPE